MRGGKFWVKEKNRFFSKEKNGTYTCVINVEYKDGTIAYEVVEERVSEKDYFKRRLDGTISGRLETK